MISKEEAFNIAKNNVFGCLDRFPIEYDENFSIFDNSISIWKNILKNASIGVLRLFVHKHFINEEIKNILISKKFGIIENDDHYCIYWGNSFNDFFLKK